MLRIFMAAIALAAGGLLATGFGLFDFAARVRVSGDPVPPGEATILIAPLQTALTFARAGERTIAVTS